jgi:hypothetical protein
MRTSYVISIALLQPFLATGAEARVPGSFTAEQVTDRMTMMDTHRIAGLKNYTVTRHYVLETARFHKRAEMTVRMTYVYPGKKEFAILSESGSGWVRKHIFRKLIEAEREAAREEIRNLNRIAPQNYQFQAMGTAAEGGRASYVLEALPKINSKYLFHGRVWVDMEDAAVSRIEGSPAVNPSLWIRKTRFVHRYEKFGPFWLPVSNRSESDVRVFGLAVVTVDYLDYRINRQEAEKASAGDATDPEAK